MGSRSARKSSETMITIDDNKTYIVELAEVLTANECLELIEKIEQLKPSLATINTATGTKVNTDVRNNERVIFDDPELAEKLFIDAKDNLPQEFAGRTICGANERFRCYRYKPGMRFAPHSDGSFIRNDQEMSFYTYLVYLNDGFEGGETTFFTKPEVVVKPVAGDAVLFQHPLVHEGSVVTEGVKYVARTDIMYRK